ncbi:15375_t:CDS:2 [Funneliformis geosporum]|uniref:6741_t:CDS:1 n=1 Tax=Funneliformis geosporum TaxID=1117311 RepID=A0A9W4WW38_9GLOM|nr:15375_t:CDS:2 [Funneliformis geosporum]CAI2183432.1 6741_t:CDS:2 [Funneliformis geosporum]
MISETLAEHSTLTQATNVVNNPECEFNTMTEENNLQQKKPEQINHENDSSSQEQLVETKTQPLISIQQEKTTIVSENMIQPTMTSDTGPVELFKYIFSSTPRMLFVLYLLILFTWSYLQRSPLILLSLGVAFGYFLRVNTVTNEVKEKIVMVKDTNMLRSLSSIELLKSAEKVKSTDLTITPKIDKALNQAFKYITRDIIDFYYDPINPNKDLEFSIQVQNSMNVMAMNLALCFQNLDKVELGIMSSFAISNTFIVHLREYRKFIATNKSLGEYCSQNESSVLTRSTDRKSQAQILRSVSHLVLARLLPSSEVHSCILMAFLSELWANQIFQTTLDTVCDPDWINCTIVEYLTDISPIDAIDDDDANLFHELANSIEAAELAEKLKQPSDSSNFIDPAIPHEVPVESRSPNLNNGSSTIQPARSLIGSPTSSQLNSFIDFKTEVNDEPTDITTNMENVSLPVSPNRPLLRSNKSTYLQKILNNPEVFAEFMAFLEERKKANLLRFWLQADSFRKISTEEVNIKLIQEDALGIFKTYFGEAATYPVKVEEEGLIRQCVSEISKSPSSNCFALVEEYVFDTLERDYFDDFIQYMKTQGEDMSFLIEHKSTQKETLPPPEDKLSFLSEKALVAEKFFKRFNTVDNSVLSSTSNGLEISQPEGNIIPEHLKVPRRSRSWSNSISDETLGELNENILDNSDAKSIQSIQSTQSTTSERSYEVDDTTESDRESITDQPKIPTMDLTGVRIKMTDVSETPNKYIYSTKSLGYMIEVEQPGSTGWIMTRSYADFEKLHQSLVRTFPKAEKVTMPRLMLKKNQDACKSLERYLNILLSDVMLCESEALQKFMKRDGLPKETLEKNTNKITKGLSILSVPKSMSMVNLVGSSRNQHNLTSSSFEESFSPKKSSEFLFRPSESTTLRKISDLLPRISTDFSRFSDEVNGKNSSSTITNVKRSSIETINSTWGSSRTGTPTTATSESDSSSIIMVDVPSNRSSIVDKLENSYDVLSESDNANFISKRRARPNKQLTSQDIDLLIDTIFAIVEEIFDLSVKSQWHLRRTVLSVLREVVRRSYTEAIKASFLMYINTLSTEEKVTSIIDNFLNSFWPNGIWSGQSTLRSEEEKLKTKEEAKKLLLQKAIPSSLKQVMGNENSRIMVGRLVDGFLAEKEVVRGMGVNILESVIKLIIAEN